MNRRGFFKGLLGIVAATAVDPEEALKLLWTPKKTIFIPLVNSYGQSMISLKAVVAQINYSIFDTEVNMKHFGNYGFLEAKDLTDCVNNVLIEHDKMLWTPASPLMSRPLYDAYQDVIRPPSFFFEHLKHQVAEAFDVPEELLGFDDESNEDY